MKVKVISFNSNDERILKYGLSCHVIINNHRQVIKYLSNDDVKDLTNKGFNVFGKIPKKELEKYLVE